MLAIPPSLKNNRTPINMTPTMPAINSFANREKLVQNLAAHIGKILTEAIARRNQAGLIVSGGSSPKPLFQALAHTRLPWSKIMISLADERWVEVSDRQSNENMVRKYLLQNQAEKAGFTGLKIGSAPAGESEELCEQRLKKLPRADILILGMGLDGHTASLLPDAPQLAAALNLHSGCLCKAIIPAALPPQRMTLTLPALLDSRRIILYISGNNKLEVLKKAWKNGPVEEMPIRAILRNQATPLSIFWSP